METTLQTLFFLLSAFMLIRALWRVLDLPYREADYDYGCDCELCQPHKQRFTGKTTERLVEDIRPRFLVPWLFVCGNLDCTMCYKRTWWIERISYRKDD